MCFIWKTGSSSYCEMSPIWPRRERKDHGALRCYLFGGPAQKTTAQLSNYTWFTDLIFK